MCPKLTDASEIPTPVLLTAQMRVTPYLLRMTWNGYPLFHHKTKKWGYLVIQDGSVVDVDNDTEIDPTPYMEDLSALVKEEHNEYGEYGIRHEGTQGTPDDELIVESVNRKALFYRLPHKVESVSILFLSITVVKGWSY